MARSWSDRADIYLTGLAHELDDEPDAEVSSELLARTGRVTASWPVELG